MSREHDKRSRNPRRNVGKKVQGVLHGYHLWVFLKYKQNFDLSESLTFEKIVSEWAEAKGVYLSSLNLSVRDFQSQTGGAKVLGFPDQGAEAPSKATP